jgi:hypothetical protein
MNPFICLFFNPSYVLSCNRTDKIFIYVQDRNAITDMPTVPQLQSICHRGRARTMLSHKGRAGGMLLRTRRL